MQLPEEGAVHLRGATGYGVIRSQMCSRTHKLPAQRAIKPSGQLLLWVTHIGFNQCKWKCQFCVAVILEAEYSKDACRLSVSVPGLFQQ